MSLMEYKVCLIHVSLQCSRASKSLEQVLQYFFRVSDALDRASSPKPGRARPNEAQARPGLMAGLSGLRARASPNSSPGPRLRPGLGYCKVDVRETQQKKILLFKLMLHADDDRAMSVLLSADHLPVARFESHSRRVSET